MFGRLISKAVLIAIILSAVFFGIGLLGFALAHALVKAFGEAGAYAIAGGVLLAVALVVLAFMALSRPRKPPPSSELSKVLLAALAKETPWLAIVGAGLASAAKLFLNRNKSSQ
jgi:Na+/melibiose symporter-like transporter